MRRSHWPRGLRRRSTVARLLRLWLRFPPGAWMFVCCECCMLSGRGLCDGLIIRPEESYRLWRVVVCDLQTSRMRRLKPPTSLWKIQPQGCNARKTNKLIMYIIVKGKAVPLQVWSGPEGSRNLRFPDFMTTAQFGVKVVSLTHRPPLPPRNKPVAHFC